MSTKNRKDKSNKSAATEPGVLTEVAQKVGTAVGTVVSALSGTSKAAPGKSSPGKKGPQRTNKTTAAKAPKQRSRKKSGSAGTDHSPLKRHRIKSKSK
jgi:hypothetical protein